MAQYQNMNQTAQTAIKGRVSHLPNPATISVQILPTSVNTFYPAAAVKLAAGASPTIYVELANPGDNIFGFVIWNPKRPNGYLAGGKIEIALPGSVMEMESGASFNRGTVLDYSNTGDDAQQVVTHTTNTPIGLALDQCTGADQLVRVYIQIGLTV